VLTTYLTRHIAYHRADLVTNVYAGNPVSDERFRSLVAGPMSHGAPAYTAQQRATQLLDMQVMRQATMLAYNDAWLFILLSFLVVIPAVFMLRKPKGGGMATDAH